MTCADRSLRPPLGGRVVAASALACLLATSSPASAECSGDCNVDGQVTVDELVTLITVGLGDAPALACPVGDADIDDRVTVDEIIGGVSNALDGCPLRRSFDFRGGRQGWQAVFADYTPEMAPNLELDAGPRTLPPELGLEGPGFLLSGFNQSDDLFMALSRSLTAADGIEPNRAYAVEYTIVFASDAPTGCSGIGGAPGESVFLKAGAAAIEPEAVLDPNDNHLRMNIDKGDQANGGVDASPAGDVANGLPCEIGNRRYVSLRRMHHHTAPVTADSGGNVWLIVGTDSGFEGTTTLYYQRIEVRLTPIGDLQLNDVSILFPLPAADGLDDLAAPAASGNRGPLLSVERYNRVPKLHVFQTPEETYGLLRVVALRIDPCFVTGSECRRQIRLTMQPVVYDEIQEVVRADDAALHLFYDLSTEDFGRLLGELRLAAAVSDVSTAGPLRVHPILAAEGLRGPFTQSLRATILRYAGADNLTRLTFMQLQNFNVNEWVFGSFNLQDGELVPIDIIDAGSQRQRFINVFLENEEDFVASVDPLPLGADDVSLLFNSNNARAASEDAIATAERAALRIENPNVHTTESVSCVACHTATQARLWTERSLGRDTRNHPDRYVSEQDLTLTSETTRIPGSLRAFGYLHQKAAISQRTVNETAAVVGNLNDDE